MDHHTTVNLLPLDKQLLENLSSKHWLTYGQINRLTEKVELVWVCLLPSNSIVISILGFISKQIEQDYKFQPILNSSLFLKSIHPMTITYFNYHHQNSKLKWSNFNYMMICRNFMGTSYWKDYKLFMCVRRESNTCLNLTFSFLRLQLYHFLLLRKIFVYINVFCCAQEKVDEKRKREILILTDLIRFKYIYHKTQDT